MTKQMTKEQAPSLSDIAAALRESIANNTPQEPAWWSYVIERAIQEHTTEVYQIWCVIKEMMDDYNKLREERDDWEKTARAESDGLIDWMDRALSVEYRLYELLNAVDKVLAEELPATTPSMTAALENLRKVANQVEE
jgi:hypothetical protein